ncbi:hypothetical protein F4778DRAFT_779623 [Xylariomycetidae sp. FL2044]|nr:hypothetical protein F4778DRAFT_779623 [Xylariomycetidae sp. FL2044]
MSPKAYIPPPGFLDFDTKRFCLQALLWSGLLFVGSKCEVVEAVSRSEVLALGPPTTMPLPTITITTTIAYKPTLIPGDPTYTLLGCYSPPGGADDSGAHAFGPEGTYKVPEAVHPENMTIPACLAGCERLPPPDTNCEHYPYVGLWNGSECLCGTQLSPDSHKVSDDDCKSPCPGDPKMSCGGNETVAVYGLRGAGGPDGALVSGGNKDDGAGDGKKQDGSNGASENTGGSESSSGSGSLAGSMTGPEGATGAARATGKDGTIVTSHTNAGGSDSTKTGASGSTATSGSDAATAASSTEPRQSKIHDATTSGTESKPTTDSNSSSSHKTESSHDASKSSSAAAASSTDDAARDPNSKSHAPANRLDDPDSPPPPLPGGAPAPAPARTIAAITGSMSGALIVAVAVILCLRQYKRKKARQDLHVKMILDRHGHDHHQNDDGSKDNRRSHHLSPIDTHLHNVSGAGGGGSRGDRNADIAHDKDIRLTLAGDLVPTTPALESGGRYPHASGGAVSAPGLHSRLTTHSSTSTAAASERDSLYSTLMGEVRAGPAIGFHGPYAAGAGAGGAAATTMGLGAGAGASSGVQWPRRSSGGGGNGSGGGPNHNNSNNPTHTRTQSRNRNPLGLALAGAAGSSSSSSSRPPPPPPPPQTTTTSNIITSPPSTAKIANPLGDRAWHRQKLSTAYQPPAPPSSSAGGGGVASNNGNRSNNNTRPSLLPRSPPSSPPRVPLPATPQPPPPPQRNILFISSHNNNNNGSAAVVTDPPHPSNGTRTMIPPLRPRRSFDTIDLESMFGSERPTYSTTGRDGDVVYSSSSPRPSSSGGKWAGRRRSSSVGSPGILPTAPLNLPGGGGGGKDKKKRPGDLVLLGSSNSNSNISNNNTTSSSRALPTTTGQGQGPGQVVDYSYQESPTIPPFPYLPPIRPGDTFDSRNWRGTMYPRVLMQEADHEVEEERDPLSAVSSIGTSILFSPIEEDDDYYDDGNVKLFERGGGGEGGGGGGGGQGRRGDGR